MIFYKEYYYTNDLNQDIYGNPEWFHEVVGYSVVSPEDENPYGTTLVKWSPKTKPAEEFKTVRRR